MRSFIIKPGDLIPIGRAGENQATEIRFDVTGWAETFGAGTFELIMQRPGDSELPYPVEVTVDGDYVDWTVSNVDTGIAGNCKVQLRYVVSDAVAKSVIYRGIVGESLDHAVDPPDPYDDLVERIEELARQTEQNAEAASRSAGNASDSADAAGRSAGNASDSADAAGRSANNAAQSVTDANAAKLAAQAAQTAAEAAQAGAEAAETQATAMVPGVVTGWLDQHVDPATGYVVDNTLSIQGAAADAKTVGDFKKALIVGNALPNWEKGSINTTNGDDYADNSRIRMLTKVGVSTGIYGFSLASGYTTLMYAWDANGNYVGAYKTDGTWSKTASGWKSVTSFDFSTVPNYVVKLAVARNPGSTSIAPSEGSNVTFYHYTDDTMTKPWKAADAQAVGWALPVIVSKVPLGRQNGYRNSSGTITGTTTTYFHAEFSLSAGERITVDYYDVATSVVVIGIFNENNQFSVIQTGTGTSARRKVSYTATGNVTVTVSGLGSDFAVYTVWKKVANSAAINDIVDATVDTYSGMIEAKVPWQYALDSVLCIGDSLTNGVAPISGSMPSPMKQCYPYYLSRLINTDVTNAGKSGASTSAWYTGYYNSYTMTNYNAVIIFLGTNAALTDTIETDVDPYEDYNDYATTETGYYCRLIKNIQHDNSNAIIVLVNLWSVATGADTSRTVINKIGAKYSLPVVDTYDLRYAVHPAYHGYADNVHMTKTGYLALAHRICTTLKSYYATHVHDANKGMTGR